MWRRAEIMRRLLLALCGLLLFAGCATTRISRAPLSAAEQELFLRGLSGFGLDGRVGVTAGEQRVNPTLAWRQQAAESRVRLSGQFGVGSLTLVYRPQFLSMTTSHGEELRDINAEQALSAQLGFLPPFEALRYWVLGLAAPGEAPLEQSTDADGRLADMTQLQWHIHYDRWIEVATTAGLARLPRRLTATRGDLSLRLFVDRWKLQAGN